MKKKNRKIPINCCEIFAMCHGKSELLISGHLRSALHVPLLDYGNNKGKNNIQIPSIMKELNTTRFKTKEGFLNHYKTIKVDKNGNIAKDFQFFIIMDTDDCTPKEKEEFLNKKIFKNHWLKPYIVPIVNQKNLEEVMKKAKIHYDKINKKQKAETYIKIFPKVQSKIKDLNDVKYIREIKQKLLNCPRTNMEKFFEATLQASEKVKIR